MEPRWKLPAHGTKAHAAWDLHNPNQIWLLTLLGLFSEPFEYKQHMKCYSSNITLVCRYEQVEVMVSPTVLEFSEGNPKISHGAQMIHHMKKLSSLCEVHSAQYSSS